MLKRYGVMGVLSKGGLVSPKYSVPPRGETMHQTPKRFRGQERARGSLSPCQVWPPGWPKRWFFCLSDCLFVTLLNVRACVSDFAMKALEYWNDFDTCSTFSDCRQLATPQNAEVQKGKNWRLSPPEGDRINRSRRNLALQCTLWVCSSAQNVVVLVTGSRRNEHIQMKFGV